MTYELKTDRLIDEMYSEEYNEEELNEIEEQNRDLGEDLYFDFMVGLTTEYAKNITKGM